MFSNPLLGPHFLFIFRFSSSFFFFYKNIDLGTPIHNPVGAKMGPKIVNCYQIVKSCMRSSQGGGFVSRPAFSETIVITVPFGPSFFVEGHLFDADWLIFLFVMLFCVLSLYNMFITFFHNTTVNAKPLSPPIFKKIGLYLKEKSLFCFFAFAAFFILLYGC